MTSLTLNQIAELTGGRVAGDGRHEVSRASSPEAAGPDSVVFVFGAKAMPVFLASAAGAGVIPENCAAPGRDVVLHRNPQAAMIEVIRVLHPSRSPEPGVHPTAVVHPSARLGADVHVGPFAVVERDAVLGDGATVGAHGYVGAGSQVGARTRLHPRVTLYDGVRVGSDCILHSGVVLGADGFGFARIGGRHRKIPQVGGVVVGDDVEIGANTCADCGTMEATRIGTNSKIDNLVQIGHNCAVGERVILCGQVGLAGSTVVGDDALLAGQVGVAGHLEIGRGVMAAAQSGITSSVESGAKVAGHPQMPLQEWLRMQAAVRHIADLRAELKRLAQSLSDAGVHVNGSGAPENGTRNP